MRDIIGIDGGGAYTDLSLALGRPVNSGAEA